VASTQAELVEIDLHEISVVAFPAYKQTSIEARSLGLPAGTDLLTYQMPVVTDEERERLRLKLDLFRRL
jgi:phage head maturation protease